MEENKVKVFNWHQASIVGGKTICFRTFGSKEWFLENIDNILEF